MSIPVRFLSAFTFYPTYLQYFYRRNPGMAEAAHVIQVTALVRGGFADGHMLTPYLDKMGWTTSDVIANDPVSQVTSWALAATARR